MTTGNQILLGSMAGTALAFLATFITNYLYWKRNGWKDWKPGDPLDFDYLSRLFGSRLIVCAIVGATFILISIVAIIITDAIPSLGSYYPFLLNGMVGFMLFSFLMLVQLQYRVFHPDEGDDCHPVWL